MQFPVNLVLTGRPVLLVGAGRIAFRKAEQLLACGADLTVVAPEIRAEFADTGARLVRRRVEPGDLDGARLVVTATGDREVDQWLFDECERRGIWINSADDPARCTFTLPAVVRRGPVMATASTGGASPALASFLRRWLDDVLPGELAEIAAVLAAERARIHAAGHTTEDLDWAPRIEMLLAEFGVDLPGARLLEVSR